jgi:hypothetical protein
MDSTEDARRVNAEEHSGKRKLDDEDMDDAKPVIQKQRIEGSNFLEETKADRMAVGLSSGVATSLDRIAQGASEAKVGSKAIAEDVQQMNVNELVEWLKPKVTEKRWKVVEEVIREQDIMGINFLNYTKADWKADGLPGGIADSLVQIAQRISEAGAPVVGYSLLSTLNKSLMKKCETRPIPASDDGKLLVVCCSDFLINQDMDEGFQQHFFLREEANREIDFFEEFLSKKNPRAAVIGGSPGSGKSLTLFTWAWCESFTADKTFVFITFLGSPKSFPLEFRFGYIQKGVFNFFSSIFPFYRALDVEDLKSFILNLKLENAVLVLDGLTNISLQLHTRFKSDFQKMFFVSSQQVFLGDPDKSITSESFKCFPWKLEDYDQVCRYDLFWNNLGKDVFDLTSVKKDSAKDEKSDVERRTKMIHRKFYFAGYSARWMFREAESTLPKLVEEYASKVTDIEKYLSGATRDKTDDAVNHILVELDTNYYVLVSFEAVRILALISRDSSEMSRYIQIFANAFDDARMRGIAYEAHIRNLLNKSTGAYIVVKDKESKRYEWMVNYVKYYNALSEIKLPGGSVSSGDWFFPCSFMQGGFDMFQIFASDGGYKVRFVQVTIAETHSFKGAYFVDVLLTLRSVVPKEFQLVEVEVVGLVPEYRLQVFKYYPIVPIERVYPGRKISHTILYCTIPNDDNWLRNPNQ